MDAVYVKARLDLVRHRRVVGVVGTLDLAALVLFMAFEAYAPGTSFADWFQAKVVNFAYLDSLFDILALAIVRWLLLVAYAANVPFFRYFFLPFFVCLCTIPYVGIKALFFGIESASWQALAALGVGLGFALIESYLLGVGVRLHLRRHDPAPRGRTATGSTVTGAAAPSAPASTSAPETSWTAGFPFYRSTARPAPMPKAGAVGSINREANEGTPLMSPFSPVRIARSTSVLSTANQYLDSSSVDPAFVTPPESLDERTSLLEPGGAVVKAGAVAAAAAAVAVSATPAVPSDAAMPSALLHQLVQPGVQLTWNNQLDSAHATLAPMASFSPRHALHLAEIDLVRQAISGRLKERDRLLKSLDLVDVLLPPLLNNPKQLEDYAARVRQECGQSNARGITANELQNWRWDLKLVVADTALWRAVTQLGAGQEIRGAFNLRRSWKLYEGLQAEIDTARVEGEIVVDPVVYHALLFGLGFFYFLVSIVPGTFLTVLEALGFKADRDKGMLMLNTVYEHGGVRSPVAAMILLANYLFIPRALTNVKALLGRAGPICRDSMLKYPRGTLFLMMASHYARKTGEVDDAIPYLTRAIEECGRLELTPNVYLNELGLCHFMKLDWERAAEVFERLVFNDDNEFELKAFVALQLSSCYIGMGRDDDGMRLLHRLPSFLTNKSNRLAKVAKQRCDRILLQRDAPFLPYELLYLRRDMAHMGKANLGRLLEKLDAKQEAIATNVERRAQFILLKGAALKFIGREEEALVLLRQIAPLAAVVVHERYAIPFSYYEIGEILYHAGKVDEAVTAFKFVAAFRGDYDFSDVLRNRIRLCFAHINSEKDQKNKAVV